MTLTTPCHSPRHSKWHIASGVVVLLTVYMIAMASIRWYLGQ